MNPIIHHRANHDLKINFNILEGEFTFEDLLSKVNKIVFQHGYIDAYNILIDIRKANFIDFLENLSLLIDYFNKNSSFFNMNRKCSFITTKPQDVVHATLMIDKIKKTGVQLKFDIFSTEEAALNWMAF